MAKRQRISGEQKNTLINSILHVYLENPHSALNYKQVSKRIGTEDRAGKDLVRLLIEELYRNHELVESNRGKYRINPEGQRYQKSVTTHMTGTVDMKQSGKAYVIPDDKSGDVFINAGNTGHALHGDTVKVSLFPIRKGRKREGEIVEVVRRNKTQFVGILEITKNYAFVVPDNAAMPVDIFIPRENLKEARHGQKVIVVISEWPEHSRNPFGKIVQVLGKPGDNQVEMQSILAEFEFPLSFTKASEKEAAAVPVEIPEKEIRSRKDFRKVFTITIDPEDAKDFDDAISLEKMQNGHWEVGIHIADVSHYVTPGSAVDKEAFQRGTSIYLVDRVIPMLPERLSNELCSLQPHKDRLCFSAVFELDEKGKIYHEWFGKTIIHSDRRFAYEEVQEIIESGKGEYAEEIRIFNTIAGALRAERFRHGSINFETQEVRFRLDESGKPLAIYLREMKEANKLIEDFMLLANRRVAERAGKKRGERPPKTFVYRVHDTPSPEKLQAFVDFIKKLGYRMILTSNKALAQSFNTLFRDIQGTGTETMIETIAIRTMAKAFYSTHNIGHYGLAFPYYTHFTSPIRRYPDLMAHRIFQQYLQGAPSVKADEYEPMCDHASEMERKAIEAERMSVRYKQAEYMLDKVGQEFDGLISGVSKWGIFVEIVGIKCEGMVRLRDLEDDFYYLDEENFQVIGQRYGYQYKLGDKVRIRVKRIDLGKKQMDFDLVI
ncbi:MAG: ribonuclease R [Bacteroidetes bacterium]|nr:MAG: ribonuclease R [Bacteroidota bacterium]